MIGKYVARSMELSRDADGAERTAPEAAEGADPHRQRRQGASGPFAPIEDAVEAIRRGEMVIVVDDEDRENEGDLTMAAEKVTPEAINFMAKHGRGLICMPMTGERLDELEIPLMVEQNSTRFETAFCVAIEAKRGTSTGISAADRAATVRAAINPKTKPSDLARPGHMFPLRARDGGVLVRAGQTEAAVDLARIAGLYPAGVICEIMNDDGTDGARAGADEVRAAAQAADDHDRRSDPLSHAHRRPRHEAWPKRMLPTEHGAFRIHGFESLIDKETHLALVCGDIGTGDDVLVRVHSKCLTGDVFTRRAATAARSSKRRCSRSRARAAACCSISTRKAAASAWPTSCAPTRCRTRASTRSKPTSGWASRPISATTASAPRSCAPRRPLDAPADQQPP